MTGPTYEEYRQIEAINWSTLKQMRISPASYLWACTHPAPDTPALALGRATHSAILEPWVFAEGYCVAEDGDGQPIRRDARTKAYQEFLAAHEGQTILTRQEYDECRAMSDAVRSHPVAGPLLDEGRAEVTIRWTDPATGLDCKGRGDWLRPKVLVDLKTARAIESRQFGGAAARYGYHAQLAMYRDGLRAMGECIDQVLIIAVEKIAPYEVAVYSLGDDHALYAGQEEYQALLRRVAECRDAGRWPSRYEEIQELQLPAWLFSDEDGDLGITIEEV